MIKVVEIFLVAFVKENAPGFPQVDQKAGTTDTLSDTRFIRHIYQVCMRAPFIPHKTDAGM